MDIVPFNSLEDALKEKKITQRTYERVKIAKSYIEKKYQMKRVQEEGKRKDWEIIMNKIDELNVTEEEANKIKKEILHKEGEYLRQMRQKLNIREFDPIAIIGKGAFGEVRVCRHKITGEIFAIKKMKKEEMHKKNQILHVRAERDVLSEANNKWIVDLIYSFQDETYLYLVMEYLPGGDLMSLLMKRDILNEDEARFYAAELVLAIESVHKLNCIHRDIKPDNVLIDINGHIKLSDFGLSKKIDSSLYEDNGNPNNNMMISQFPSISNMSKNKRRRIYAYSVVGTPDYIAPEVFSQKGYGPEVDWWSLGVILFEMLVGYPPFFSDNATDTCKTILNWKSHLAIPPESNISREAVDLIKKLINDQDKRLGINGAEEIKRHPFFKKIDWRKISDVNPPFIPEIENDFDTHYFDNFDEDCSFYPDCESKKVNKDICFVDFTYKKENENHCMVSALEVLDSIKESLKKTDFKENGGNAEEEMKEFQMATIVDEVSARKSVSNIINEESYFNIKKHAINGQGNIPSERPGSDYLLKSNIEFEKPKPKNVKTSKYNISSINKKASSNLLTDKKIDKKPPVIKIEEGFNYDDVFSKRKNNNPVISIHPNNPQLSSNYLKDFISSENKNLIKSNQKPIKSFKTNSIVGKPDSTKSSNTKKFLFSEKSDHRLSMPGSSNALISNFNNKINKYVSQSNTKNEKKNK